MYGVLAGRALAGVFAASVPVAQAGVTDILPRNQTSLGLSRVSAASQLGVVVGPAASAVFQAAFAAVGLPSERCLPAVFVTAALFAIGVLMQMAILDRRCRGGQPEAASSPAEVTSVSARADDELQPSSSSTEGEDAPVANPAANPAESDRSLVASVRMAQPMLRTVTIIIGWTAVLSNSIYGLFAPRFLGFWTATAERHVLGRRRPDDWDADGVSEGGGEDWGASSLRAGDAGGGNGHRRAVTCARPANPQHALHGEPHRRRHGRHGHGRSGGAVFRGEGSALSESGPPHVDSGRREDSVADSLQ